MTRTITLELPPLHPAQRAIAEDDHRFRVVTAGRRFGKTLLGSLLCLAAATRPGGLSWWVAPTHSIASIGWRTMRLLAAQIPGAIIHLGERVIELPSGGRVGVKSADNPDSLRGIGLNFVVLDECAFIKEETWTEVLRPALADRQGGALFISTPKGRSWFWRLYQRGLQGDDPQYRSFHFSSYDNPEVPASEWDSLRTQIPERLFRQEIMAEFLDDGGGVFRHIEEASTAAPQEEAEPGHQYIFGVDWARTLDFTAFAVVDQTSRELVKLDRFNQVDYATQKRRLEALYDRFRPVNIVAERNSMGDPLVESLRQQGLPVMPFLTTNASKAIVIDGLALAFERFELRILQDEALLGELHAYDVERLPSGLLRYGAPNGLHDDTVMALALAWYGASIPPASSLVDFA